MLFDIRRITNNEWIMEMYKIEEKFTIWPPICGEITAVLNGWNGKHDTEIKEFLPGYCRHRYVISHWGRTLVFEANSITQMIRRRIEAPNNRCWLTPYQKPIFQQLLQKLQKHPKLWNESQPRNRPFDVLHFSII